ncbi:pulmonary surfactant-associated protein D-like [Crotalus tigris]|uniref:pulmonary surfactant-associated protein D-like n=1 Tax=Crotalus tigris TaxID=88082 RepID=UPI00192F7480|nr:pulmonary surfactant-associated protein D-like [Crotalus tigris]XP_039196674.1 pulmonary surfactant-associated protein D-like [Crotalus tigris]
MLVVLLFCAFASAVSSVSTPAPKQEVHSWNACSLVVCGPAEKGIPGRDGRDGIQGLKGEKGEQGLLGPKGSLGPPGKMGPAGPAGQKGSQGNPGTKGDAGQIGPRGIQGLQGPSGNVGPSGPKGNIGPQGEKGVKGEMGLKGALGPPGPQGKIGAPGPAGAKGSMGEKGAKGDRGVQGLQGPPGPLGPKGNPGSPGPKGERGTMGEKGTKGDSGLSEVNLLKTKVSSLEGQLKALQASFAKYQKVAMFPGGRSVGNKVFITNSYEGNFEDLRLKCAQAGGLLATPRNVAENDAIQKIAVMYNKGIFLGITDLKTEGTFKYLNDQPITYSNWLQGEPNNNQGKENCVEMFSNGKWNDKSCGEKRLLVCEF